MTMAARAATVVLGAAAIVLATACTRVVDDARVVAAPDMGKAGASASDCTSVDAPMTSIAEQTDEEPLMKIPQPEGWERVTMMDSELIRFTMRNEALVKDGFAPTAVVTLESHPGIAEPRQVFDAQQDALKSGIGATNISVSRDHALRAARRDARLHDAAARHTATASGYRADRRDAHRQRHIRDDDDCAERRPGQPDISARRQDDHDRLPDAPAVRRLTLIPDPIPRARHVRVRRSECLRGFAVVAWSSDPI